MQKTCPRCCKLHDKFKDEICRRCYELQLLRGQCLNASVLALAHQGINPDWEDYPKKVFDIVKKLFNEAIEREFLEWYGEKKKE